LVILMLEIHRPVLASTGVITAPLPEAADIVTAGALAYPEPPFVMVMPVITLLVPGVTTVRTAPVPPPPDSDAVGVEVYPDPGLVMVTPDTPVDGGALIVSVAAVVGDDPAIERIVGTAVYPTPAFVTVTLVIFPPLTAALAVARVPPAGGAEKVIA
jgi:hypothetical protein